MSDDRIDWDTLREAAVAAARRAYAPYSSLAAGAAAIAEDGRLVSGCNVENASYGLTLCAECSLVSALAMSGGGRLVAVVCVDGNGDLLMPCGRCRQLLYEHGGPDLVLLTPDGERPLLAVLPQPFGRENLPDSGLRRDRP